MRTHRLVQLIPAAGFAAALFITIALIAGCPTFPDKEFPDDDADTADDTGDDDSDDDTQDDTQSDDTQIDDDSDDDSAGCTFETDFEDGVGEWTHGGTHDEWELGLPSAGPEACHSGSNCWATDLNDDYDPNANEWLMSPVLHLSGQCRISFWHWYDLTAATDKAYFEITEDGTNWDSLKNFSGSSADWAQTTVSLLGREGYVSVRWRLDSNTIILPQYGWAIDDVLIDGL